MHKHFIAAREEKPGEVWLARFVAGRDAAASWYLGQGLEEPPTAAECRSALLRHMPELIRRYDEACALVGDDDLAHRILSHYRPPPMISGCTQAIWLGQDGPALVRNYDYPLDLVTGRIESSAWFGHEIIAKAQAMGRLHRWHERAGPGGQSDVRRPGISGAGILDHIDVALRA